MPIFISYSHQDKDFVDQLAAQLVRNRVYIWLDRWSLHVGDSLTARIEEAITSASALLVILSKASVKSAWCKREITSGLLLELEERRTVVLPVLAEDCDIPLFLRDKLYADFRTNFDDGLRTVLEATARISNPNTGRVEEPEYHMDWSVEWGELDSQVRFRATIIQEAVSESYTILSTLIAVADDAATKDYHQQVKLHGSEIASTALLSRLINALNEPEELRIILTDQYEKSQTRVCVTPAGAFTAVASARRLGEDNGRDVIVGLGSHLETLAEGMRGIVARPSSA